MVVHMQIVFNNQENKYFSGESVSGRLIVHSKKTVTLRSIRIIFEGKSETQWTEVEDSYSAKEKYFTNVITVYAGSGQIEKLPPGEYSYDFSMMVPEDIPSSFKTSSGHVQYKVKAKVDPPQRIDPYVEKLINVISPINLNMDPQYRLPLTKEIDRYFCCLCCKKGPLTIVSKIPLRGYVSGDVIPVILEVDNVNDHEIVVKCRLRRTIICYTKNRNRSDKESENIVSTNLGSVPPYGSRTWKCNIKVPSGLTPSFLNKCQIIDLNYSVQVLALSGGSYIDLVNDLPIVIGTTPLSQDTMFT
ncbi:hypothetical protein C0J52_22358 [Blattella germanica]|nr:hypothetical protein C0J52_22358 [Blattella germanica]